MKSIFDYLDYRAFLKDFYDHKKGRNPHYSYRVFGDKAGVDGSHLAKVLIGARHIAEDSIKHFAAACGFQEAEAEYFETLVYFGKAKTDAQEKNFFDKLLTLKADNAKKLVADQFEYYGHWYHSAVRLIVEHYDFKGDYAALAATLNPPITAKEAEDSIILLTKLGLVEPGEDGRYRMTNQAVTTGAEWQAAIVETFQEETIRLSREAIKRHPKHQRDISTVTMNINAQDYGELRVRIREFRKSLINFVNKSVEPDRTYQMNVQFFPLSKIPPGQLPPPVNPPI